MPAESCLQLRTWGTDPVLTGFTMPEIAPGEVLIEVEACGIGRTVLNCISGNVTSDPSLLPLIPGHELVGIVVAAGPDADAALVGRRVAAYFYLNCGKCAECTRGRESLCLESGGLVGVHRDGGYGPYVALPSANAIEMPEGLGAVDATVVPDAVATPVRVASRAGIGPGDRVAVLGSGGGVGVHMVQVAKLTGADVAGLDVTDAKLAVLQSLGVRPVRSDHFESLDPANVFPEGRPTAVIDFVGTAASLAWSISAIEPGGRVVLMTASPAALGSTVAEIVMNETTVLGSRYASKAEVRRAAELVASGRVRPVIGTTTGLDGVVAVHDQIREGTLIGRGALSW